MQFIDSHAHLYFDRFDDDRNEVIARAREAGFVNVMNIGIDLETSRQSLELAQEYPGFCYASAGLHPNYSGMNEADLESVVVAIHELIVDHKKEIRAIGEIGLDYYRDHAPPDQQKRSFVRQLALAQDLDLPVIIHCREALPDCLELVEQFAGQVRGIFHCFAGSAEQSRRIQDFGWYVSFAGNVTFPRATELVEAARATDPDRLLLETDAPFLAPQAVRGKRNEPIHSVHTCRFLAALYGLTLEELAAVTTRNARSLFDLPGKP